MNLVNCNQISVFGDVMLAAQQACAAIAPCWPLDRSIAVNPYWELRDREFTSARDEMRLLAASRMSMPVEFYRELWERGSITLDDLLKARDEEGDSSSVDELIRAIAGSETKAVSLPLLSDMLDLKRDPEHQILWREHVTTQISQCCASFFDHYQADWSNQDSQSLYAYWSSMIRTDLGGALLMGDSGWRERSYRLPSTAEELLRRAAASMSVAPEQLIPWFRVALHRIHGWASWCTFLSWQAKLEGGQEPCFLLELLAIRIAWEWILFDGENSHTSMLSQWHIAWQQAMNTPPSPQQRREHIWLRAHELSYQRELLSTLAEDPAPSPATAQVQAVFCIDVRSEVVRRHIEWIAPEFETLGFAGFFGVPMDYQPLGSDSRIPHLPGLFAAQYLATETTGDALDDKKIAERRRTQRTQLSLDTWHMRQPASSFNLVEALGPLKMLPLWKGAFGFREQGRKLEHASQRVELRAHLSASVSEKAEIAARFLKATGLCGRLAPTVLLVGHGAQTTNNPLASALDCGACCGQNGLTNARVLSEMLNDPAVRTALQAKGIEIPQSTLFVAALHNTTLDTVTMDTYDRNRLSPAVASQIQGVFEDACEAARQERAAQFGFAPDASSLRTSAQHRASNWAELRPEWGLVDNAALIVGSRSQTRGLDLKGRSFLHEYDPEDDLDGSLLAQILGGPMVVTNWINLQYFASCVDPLRFGSGNKTLHNVVGGHIGVFEGNGGDLRIGLAKQSVHDGERWRHNPIRLTVVVYAPKERVEAALRAQPLAQDLVRGQWLHLFTAENNNFHKVLGN
ncbi:MAG TPA: DUF2309 domain-containing protein [Edaphobacter sp.]|nr:DUF2309 domain-containing protein [Edaphobacter sp.]